MVIQVSHLRQPKFWKNNTEQCGALYEAIHNKTKSEIVLFSWTKKTGKLWGCVTPDKALDLIKKNNGWYEVMSDFPHKVYFDIDAPVDRLYNDIEQKEHLHTILDAIYMYFIDADCAVSGSYTDKKISYHITLQNYMIYSLQDRETMKVLNTHIKESMNLPFDNAVYTKNRNMKCINQTKSTDNRVQEIIMNDNWKAHMITCFFNNHILPFPEFKQDVKEKIEIAKAKTPFNLATLPTLNIKTPINIKWDTLTPDDVLGLLPCSSHHDHSYTHKVARFCHTNKIAFEMFLSWLSQKHTGMPQNIVDKWNVHFSNINKFPPCHISNMKPILAHYYPDIKKDIHLRNFKEMFDIDENIKRIKIDRLSQEHYTFDTKLSCFHLGMGCGKTAQTIDFLANNTEENFMWLGHRQSLHQGTYKRICDTEIECCDYMKGTKETKPILYNDANNLGICVNSLIHLKDSKKYDIIVIDEIESVLEAFIGDFMQKKNEILNKLCNLIKSAKKIIVLDAFITKKTIEFFRTIEEDMSIDIVYKEVTMTNNIYFKNILNDENIKNDDNKDKNEDYKMTAIAEIVNDLKQDKKVFIFYPYKKDMAEIAKTIEISSGKKCIYYHADRGDDIKKTLCNVNETWSNFDCVITNTCITCGVNFDLNAYNSCWLFLAGFVKPRDAIQASARIRNLLSKTINVVFLGKKLINPSVYIDDRKDVNNSIYDTIYKNSLIEDKAPRRKTFEIFCQKSGYKMDRARIVFDKQLLKEIKSIFDETNCAFDFMDIPMINEADEEHIKQLVMSHQANLMEKLMLKKCYIMKEFNSNVLEEEIGVLWENDLLLFFQKLNKICNNVEEVKHFTAIFNEIQKQNGWDFLVPCGREINTQVKQKFTVKLSDKMLEDIFIHYNFRDINKHSKPIQIIKHIFNITFGTTMINTKCDGKHTTASLTTKVIQFMPLISYLIRKGTLNTNTSSIQLNKEDWIVDENVFPSKSSSTIGPIIDTYFYK
jgi:hypothetical protein